MIVTIAGPFAPNKPRTYRILSSGEKPGPVHSELCIDHLDAVRIIEGKDPNNDWIEVLDPARVSAVTYRQAP